MNRPSKPSSTYRHLLTILAGLWLVVGLRGSISGAEPDVREHWAFQKVRRAEPPVVKKKDWVRNPIDQFILASLEARALLPARPATREQFIRRVSFDLIGLPPAPGEIDLFVNDASSNAYEVLIDRLLASPHYGERWGRHWLDLVRYAESDGFEHDAIRPHSWRYRDYVVQSFNADKPYDRFIREQIAGDELWPEEPAALAATAFTLLGPDMVDSADQVQRRLLTLSDMTDTTAFAFLGLTLGCARCHNHKSEPFTQKDYYALQAFFAPAQFQRELPIPSPDELAAHQGSMATYRAQADSTQKQLDALEEPGRTKLYEQLLSRLSEDAQLAHRTPREKRTMEQEGTVQETAPMLKITEAELVKVMSAEDKARRRRLLDSLKKIPEPAPLPMTMALKNSNGPPAKTYVLVRGDYNNPTEQVQPGFPAVLGREAYHAGSAPAEEGGTRPKDALPRLSRAALAQWLASAENPLTARVMVNRIWQHHLGRGIVPTSSNFGTQGARPTHPELLDWLADEFRTRGWSIKALHKLILLSATYQQSSETTRGTLNGDPENKLFSRQNRARLEGEGIRDSLLVLSGRLNSRIGGPSVFPPIPVDITKTSKNWTASAEPEDHYRRSIYIFARRNLRFPFLEVFDAPDSNLSCPERGQSTTAPQSLTLLNSDEAIEAATLMAERLMNEARETDERIQLAFRLALGRRPGANELSMAREFLRSNGTRDKEAHSSKSKNPGGLPPNPKSKMEWAELCRALFNLNAFVYIN